MNPEQLPEDNNVELEAIARNGLEGNDKLDGIEQNTAASAIKLDDLNTTAEANVLATTKLEDPLNKIVENTTRPEVQKVKLEERTDDDDPSFNENEAGKALWSMLRGPKGKAPIKGKDYFTESEINSFKKDVTPVKGKDYYTSKEIEEIKKEVTPKKGVDYTDGPQGERGVPGKNPLTASTRPPKNPQIGDLWYKI